MSVKLKVNWESERADANDDNNGYLHGVYVFDVTEEDFDEESGYGGYDVIHVEWFKTKQERDEEFDKL